MLTDTADKLKVVTNGAIILDTAVLLIDHDDVKVWNVEAKSKYAQLAGCTDGYNPTVWFAKTEESLNLDEDVLGTVTVLELELPDDGKGGTSSRSGSSTRTSFTGFLCVLLSWFS